MYKSCLFISYDDKRPHQAILLTIFVWCLAFRILLFARKESCHGTLYMYMFAESGCLSVCVILTVIPFYLQTTFRVFIQYAAVIPANLCCSQFFFKWCFVPQQFAMLFTDFLAWWTPVQLSDCYLLPE